MKQNNRLLGWTTLEESKQLLESGLPIETADMSYTYDFDDSRYVITVNPAKNWIAPKYAESTKIKQVLPCWSLGALMKLMPKTISIPIDERSAYFYNLEWQFANDNSLRYIATNRGKCLIDIYSDHDIGSKSFIETVIEMIIWLLENKLI